MIQVSEIWAVYNKATVFSACEFWHDSIGRFTEFSTPFLVQAPSASPDVYESSIFC